MLYYVIICKLCYVMLGYVTSCFVLVCHHDLVCYSMLCYAMQLIMLYHDFCSLTDHLQW